jgi:predicted transcriptional regulator
MSQATTVRISVETNERLNRLAQRLGSNKRAVIDQALDALEKQLFWQGWDEEATAYLTVCGEIEERERENFAGTLRDRLDQ